MLSKNKHFLAFLDFLFSNLSSLITIFTSAYIVFLQSSASTKLPTDDLLTAILAVLGLLSLSEIIERYKKLHSIEETGKKTLRLLENKVAERPSAIAFFSKSLNLEQDILISNQIDLSGITLTNLIDKNLSNLRDKLLEGSNIRILIVDPTSDGLKMSTLRSEDPTSNYYKVKLEATLQNLQYLQQYAKKNTAKGKLEVRLLPYASSFAIYSFNKTQLNGHVIVEIYPHSTGWGYPPIFDLSFAKDGKWYEYFVKQFDGMWDTANKCDLNLLIDRNLN